MHAVIETGGKQFKVKVGDVIRVEKLDVGAGEVYTFDKVLAVMGDDEQSFGSPYLAGASVKADVVKHDKAKKVVVFKYKPKKMHKKKRGHRQPFTELKITAISK